MSQQHFRGVGAVVGTWKIVIGDGDGGEICEENEMSGGMGEHLNAQH